MPAPTPACWLRDAPHPPPAPPPPTPAALNSEQKALLDFLVLARAQRFAGFGSSTFSFYLREHRALQVRACCFLACLPASASLTPARTPPPGLCPVLDSPHATPPTAPTQGLPRTSSALVDASVIGTDPLFKSAGTVVGRRR